MKCKCKQCDHVFPTPAIARCPRCGGRYVTLVRDCPECGAKPVHQKKPAVRPEPAESKK